MESLSFDRCIYNLAKTPLSNTGYSNPFFVGINNSFLLFDNYASPTDYSVYKLGGLLTDCYTPGSGCGQMFDSNLYLNNFAMQSRENSPGWLTDIAIQEWSLPQFSLPKFSLPKISFSKSSVASNSKKRNPGSDYRNYTFNTSIKYKSLSDAGYNTTLAARLAKDITSHVERRSTGYCSKYVSDALERLGIVGERGHAYELKDSLRKNPHFKEIDVNSVDVRKLPAGCVLVYDRGAGGYSSKHGHVEITLGNGTAASDYINRNIRRAKNMTVFVPVSA